MNLRITGARLAPTPLVAIDGTGCLIQMPDTLLRFWADS